MKLVLPGLSMVYVTNDEIFQAWYHKRQLPCCVRTTSDPVSVHERRVYTLYALDGVRVDRKLPP